MCAAQGSSVVTKIAVVLTKPTDIPSVIGTALTGSSNFFINYVAIQVATPGRMLCWRWLQQGVPRCKSNMMHLAVSVPTLFPAGKVAMHFT